MSWWQLRAIQQEGRQIRQAQGAMPPVSCPNDGQVLLRDRNGNLRCNFDGWVWDGTRNPLVSQSSDNLTPVTRGPGF